MKEGNKLMNKPLIVIGGPTASGKTKIGIELAKSLDGEIISADSMQVYRHMDIGTAKPTPQEMENIPHHLLNIVNPDEEWNVALFQQKAKKAIEDIYQKKKIPIIVGGTGFYIQSVIYDIEFKETKKDGDYRNSLEQKAKIEGSGILHQQLERIDPISAKNIHPNNVKRIIRALEYYQQTGEPISLHNEIEKQKSTPYQLVFFALTMERTLLYERINKRVDQMIEKGLIAEVNALLKQGYGPQLVSMQGLGYKEIIEYLLGNCSLEEAIYILKRDTRHFAKRQLTWFRREKEVNWIHVDQEQFNYTQIMTKMRNHVEEVGKII